VSSLDGEQYISLGTFRKNGKEVLTPVWFAADPKQKSLLWVYTNVNAGKVKRVRNNGRARVAPCGSTGRLKGEFQNAKARMVEAGDKDWQHGWQVLHAKYWMLGVGLFFSRFTGRYQQRGLMAVELV
jgi:PPOX class probable F420-dependent enzyme